MQSHKGGRAIGVKLPARGYGAKKPGASVAPGKEHPQAARRLRFAVAEELVWSSYRYSSQAVNDVIRLR